MLYMYITAIKYKKKAGRVLRRVLCATRLKRLFSRDLSRNSNSPSADVGEICLEKKVSICGRGRDLRKKK